MRFNVGQKVRWRSQSQGSWTQKEGEIVAIVPAGGKPSPEYPAAFKQSNFAFRRKHDSYVVLVGKKHYWPRVSNLELV